MKVVQPFGLQLSLDTARAIAGLATRPTPEQGVALVGAAVVENQMQAWREGRP